MRTKMLKTLSDIIWIIGMIVVIPCMIIGGLLFLIFQLIGEIRYIDWRSKSTRTKEQEEYNLKSAINRENKRKRQQELAKANRKTIKLYKD